MTDTPDTIASKRTKGNNQSLVVPLSSLYYTYQFSKKVILLSFCIRYAALGNLKASFHCTHWHRFFPLKKVFFESLRLPFQRELHILTKPSLLRKEGCNRPTRCSEPLRSKVGGPSKVYAMVVRDGTALIRCFLCLILRHILYESEESKD